jgi:hypothetical protein
MTASLDGDTCWPFLKVMYIGEQHSVSTQSCVQICINPVEDSCRGIADAPLLRSKTRDFIGSKLALRSDLPPSRSTWAKSPPTACSNLRNTGRFQAAVAAHAFAARRTGFRSDNGGMQLLMLKGATIGEQGVRLRSKSGSLAMLAADAPRLVAREQARR